MMLSTIEKLPTELLDYVVHDFDLETHRAFRLSSTRLCSFSFSIFRKKFFTRISSSLDSLSLQQLLALSSCRQLASAVRRLDIELHLPSPKFYQDIQQLDLYNENLPLRYTPKIKDAEKLIAQRCLLDNIAKNRNPDIIIDPLCRALRGFDEIVELRLVPYGIHYRCAISYESSAFIDFQGGCLKALILAIIRSGVRLERLTMFDEECSPPSFRTTIVPWYTFSLPLPLLTDLSDSFENIRSLDLCVKTRHRGQHRLPGWENGISQFLSAAANLEHLCLTLDGLVQYTYNGPILESLARSTTFVKLSSFRLRACAFDEEDLAFFALRHKRTLRKVSLEYTRLLNGTWKSLLMLFRNSLQLERVHLCSVKQDDEQVMFASNSDSSFHKDTCYDITYPHEYRTMTEMLCGAISSHQLQEANAANEDLFEGGEEQLRALQRQPSLSLFG